MEKRRLILRQIAENISDISMHMHLARVKLQETKNLSDSLQSGPSDKNFKHDLATTTKIYSEMMEQRFFARSLSPILRLLQMSVDQFNNFNDDFVEQYADDDIFASEGEDVG